MESVFIHVTVVPTAMSSSPGTKALFPSDSAPTGIVTDDDGTPVVGVGDAVGGGGVGDEGAESPPQAIANIKNADMAARRIDNIRSSEHESE